MNELLAVLILVLTARGAGELATRLNQSPMLGEILGGLLLGPTILNLVKFTGPIELLSHLGILLLMFLAGMETDLRLIRKVAGKSLAVSVSGQLCSLALGYGVGILFGLSSTASIFLGAALSSSSIVVAARIFSDYGMMDSEVGFLSMATNAIDDIVGMFVLLLVVAVVGQGSQDPIWLMLLKLVAYAALASAVGLFLFQPMMRLVGRLRSDEAHFTVAILLVLVYSWSAGALGLADVIGAFLAGAFLHYTEEAEPSMLMRVEAVSDGFLVPIFFAAMGLQTDLRQLLHYLPFLLVVILVAVISKLVGCGGAARLMGYSWPSSYIVGAGMVARAEMTLVLLGIGLRAHVLPPVMPPLLVSLVFLSAVITAPLLRLGLRTTKAYSPVAG